MLQKIKSKIKYLSVAKKLSILLCVILLGSVTIGSTYAYVVMGTPSLVNLFINGLIPDGDLTIEKNLQHPYGDQYVLPEGLEFDFRVDLGEEYAGETIKTTQGEKTADKNGAIKLTVAPGGRTTVFDIDGDTKVTVKEISLGKGFTADKPEQEITIKKYKDNILTFVNTYKPEAADASQITVKGSKNLEGRLWQEGDSFTFRMEVFEDGQWVSLGEENVEYKKDTEFNKFSFTKYIRQYDFAKAGTYSLRVTEVEGSIGGITYDKAESYFNVLVGDADMDGALEIQCVKAGSSNTTVENNTAVSIKFINKYAPEGSARVSIDIAKTLIDRSGAAKSPAGFDFELLDAEGKVVTTSEVTTVEGLTGITLVYTPADAGKTFEYQLREVGSGETVDSMKYDDRVYDLEVVVHDDLDGTVSAEINGSNRGEHVSFAAEFENEYDPLNAAVTLSGDKILDGRDMEYGEFDFRLYEVKDDSFSMDGAKLLDTASNDSDGDFTFDALNYSKVGTYRYLIIEDDSDAIRGITYDDTSYWVTVVVTDKNGRLVADKKIADDKGQTAAVKFTNSYRAESVSWSFTAEKTYEDKSGDDVALRDGQFQFEIYAADEDFVQQGGAFKTVSNDADGDVTFDGITFSEEGTYRYVIKEQIPEGAATNDYMEGSGDVAYDNAKYCVEVKVEDDGEGQLEVDSIDITGDGVEMDEVVFSNIYLGEAPSEPSEPSEPTDPTGPTDEPTTEPDEPTDKPTVKPSDQPGTSQPQDGPDKPGKDKGTQTGDDSNLTLAVILLLVSACLAAAVVVIRRRDAR